MSPEHLYFDVMILRFGLRMKRVLTTGCLLLLLSCASAPSPERPDRHDHSNISAVKDILRMITIPEVNLRQTTAEDALAFWIMATRDHHPAHVGVSTVIEGTTETRVEIKTGAISSFDLLNLICRQAGLVWWLAQDHIMVAPEDGQRNVQENPNEGRPSQKPRQEPP